MSTTYNCVHYDRDLMRETMYRCRHCDPTVIFLKKCEPKGVDHD